MAYLILNVSHWLEFMAKEINMYVSSLLWTSCGRMSKQMSIWDRWKPFNSDVLLPRFISLSFCRWYQQGALQGSSTWHSVMVSWNFGPQHPSPTWIDYSMWVLLDWWRIKSPGCQMSMWESSSLSLCDPSFQQHGKGRIFKSSRWDLFMILMSRGHFPAWWPAEFTCMSQAQQIWWAYCLLHLLCTRMKHYCLNHVCLL